MNRHKKILFGLLAAVWAVYCGGVTYKFIQREEHRLYQAYFTGCSPAGLHEEPACSNAEKTQVQHRLNRKAYENERFELYWIVSPFFWLSISLSGVVIALGIFLPLRRLK